MDECLQNICGKGTKCINTLGSYECHCKNEDKYYDHQLKKCRRQKCPANTCKHGKCISNKNGYSCHCKPGYTGSKCEHDIDECQTDNDNPCEHNCENTPGSYKCSCHPGYKLDTFRCIDINECASVKCDFGRCINEEGSFRCECDSGYNYDPMTQKCVPLTPECKRECSHACGADGECICPKGYKLNTDNLTECIKKTKKKKKKKKRQQGCQAYNATEGIHVSYSKDLNLDTLLYPRGTSVKGKCLQGYQSEGKLRKKCKKDGSWQGKDLSCQLITCPSIENLDPGVIVLPESCSSQNSIMKTKCMFSCQDPKKYKLIGTKVARCRKNGEWKQKGGPPKCIEKPNKKKKKDRKKNKKNKIPKAIGHPLSTITGKSKTRLTYISISLQ